MVLGIFVCGDYKMQRESLDKPLAYDVLYDVVGHFTFKHVIHIHTMSVKSIFVL